MWGSYTDAQRIAVLDEMSAAGVKWVRIDIGWDALETQRGVWDAWHVGLADRCVDWARTRGLKVDAQLEWTPGWANNNAGSRVPPSNANDYGDAAEWMANHFKGRVQAWEVWNEMNLTDFWQGTVGQYVQMLKAAYPRFKTGDPAALVLFGGVAYNDDGYIGQAYAAGAQGSFDVMAVHPYQAYGSDPPESTPCDTIWKYCHTPAVHDVMARYGDGAKPIWFTEYGWSSHANAPICALITGNWEQGVTEDQQADYYVRALQYAAANFPWVQVAFWYNERNNNTDPCSNWGNLGLLRNDLTEKPVYAAMKSYLGR